MSSPTRLTVLRVSSLVHSRHRCGISEANALAANLNQVLTDRAHLETRAGANRRKVHGGPRVLRQLHCAHLPRASGSALAGRGGLSAISATTNDGAVPFKQA
jgi:hypothetical protein